MIVIFSAVTVGTYSILINVGRKLLIYNIGYRFSYSLIFFFPKKITNQVLTRIIYANYFISYIVQAATLKIAGLTHSHVPGVLTS